MTLFLWPAAPLGYQFLTPRCHELVDGIEQTIVEIWVRYLAVWQEQLHPRALFAGFGFSQHVAEVLAVHYQDVVVFVKMMTAELLGPLRTDIHAVPPCYGDRPVVRRVAHMPVAGSGGIDRPRQSPFLG